jgi:tetratricopeptide (TPR) repeat protein
MTQIIFPRLPSVALRISVFNGNGDVFFMKLNLSRFNLKDSIFLQPYFRVTRTWFLIYIIIKRKNLDLWFDIFTCKGLKMMTVGEVLDADIESLSPEALALLRTMILENQSLFYAECEVFYQWGKIEQKLDMPHSAEVRFKKALFLNKEHTKSMRELGLLYKQSERLNDALRLFAMLVTIDPTDREAWRDGGNILLSMHEPHRAMEWMKMAKRPR